jgi:hypothetical protein
MKILILLAFVSVASCSFADDTNAIYQTNFQQLIGKSLYSQDIEKFFSHFSNEPFIDDSAPTVSYYEFQKEGMILHFKDYGTESSPIFQGVLLYGQNSDGYTPYKGPLPYGLNFNMTRGEVEQKLGLPGQDSMQKYYNFASYFTKYLVIEYETNAEYMPSNNMKIVSIAIQ